MQALQEGSEDFMVQLFTDAEEIRAMRVARGHTTRDYIGERGVSGGCNRGQVAWEG